MNSKYRLVFILFFCLFSVSLFGIENDNLIFKLDSISGTIDLDTLWRYHLGDDTLWANQDFDDSEWDTISTQLNLLRIDEGTFEGLGWFRLHIRIDSTLRNKSFALLIDQQGASEIYLNGNLIQSFGTFSDSIEKEKTSNPKMLPGLLQFNNGLNYVLAVRYSNLNAHRNLKIYQEANAGFELRIEDHEIAMQNLKGQLRANCLVGFLLMIFLVLSMVHFLLFIFYRKQKSNLYYSIFMLLFSGIIFLIFLSNGITEYPPLLIKAGFVISLVFPLFFLPLTGFLYSLFMDKTPRLFWITTGLAVVLSILSLFDISFISTLYIGFIFLLWIEVMRVVIRAMIKKYDGAWIIGIGVIFFILFFTFIIIYVIRYGDLTLSNGSVLALIFGLAVLAAILSIPLSMSIYLARDFARTNFNLEKQLEQVKILSAKTLEQEREKKRILESQKEKLEILVAERTKELASERKKRKSYCSIRFL